MTKVNPDLVRDLAKLTRKYKAKDWEDLGRLLQDPDQLRTFQALVEELAKASRQSSRAGNKKPRKPPRSTKVREAIAALRKEDAARADLLEDLWQKLRQQDLLPTIASVRTFAEAMGFKGIKSSRREQAIAELMERLLELPAETLEGKMRQTVVEDRQLGNEYEAWVDMILRRPRVEEAKIRRSP